MLACNQLFLGKNIFYISITLRQWLQISIQKCTTTSGSIEAVTKIIRLISPGRFYRVYPTGASIIPEYLF